MEIFIYFQMKPDTNIDRNELEDAIDEFLDGKGEVTGGGAGIDGANIDVELFDEGIKGRLIERLRELPFAEDTYYVVDGVRTRLFE
ncbi:MAG: hypothetical protein IJ794_13780 [Lachnospiraceae bacterium]|nr:hypothetical protein [Lachnospiraceae bacterium]